MKQQRPWLLYIVTLLIAGETSPAIGAETVQYTYDALGRLVTTARSGSVNNSQSVTISFDAAGNRTNYAASSAPPAAACNFSAANVEGPDEFTVYASIDRISSCSETIGISYSVTYISGSGQYNVGGFWPAGSSILPSDQYKLLSISPFYGTVLPGSPLRLKLTWNVISGSGSISPSEACITFYNSDCYC